MSRARQALLDRIVEHVAAHGLSGLSLRELAAGIGTSHRMLLYHFGSREGLLAAVVGAVEQQQRDALRSLAEGSGSPTELIRSQWAQLSDPVLRPYIVLFFEVVALAMQQQPGTEGFLERLTSPWLDAGAAAADQLGIKADAGEILLGIAVLRGLLLEAVASGDYRASTGALERFLAMWEGARRGRETLPSEG